MRLSVALLIGLAITAAMMPLPAAVVERFYSNGVYPYLQQGLTGASNLVPFALFDVLLVAVIGWWGWKLWRDIVMAMRSRTWSRAAGSIVLRTVIVTACAYLGFLAAWGLNYRRPPLPEEVAYDRARITEPAAQARAASAAPDVQAIYDSALPS